MSQENGMNIIYAAEKPSIAGILSDFLEQPVNLEDVDVADNPDQTGSFLVSWRFKRFVLSPDGELCDDRRLD